MDEDDGKPPLLSRAFDGEEEDHFVEMEEEEDEEEEEESSLPPVISRQPVRLSPQNHEVEPTPSFEIHSHQEPEPSLEILDQYNERNGSKSRLKFDFDHRKYLIEYRPSQYKSRNKNSHNVAIVAKVDANLCHEFSYNRTSEFDGSKFYTCLGCRKAKAESRMKDVIRTIRIDERYRTILSKGDPFDGHHHFCVSLPWAPDARSYGHVLPQPMHMDLGEYAPSELVYMDTESEAIWEGEGSSYLENIPFYGEAGPPQPEEGKAFDGEVQAEEHKDFDGSNPSTSRQPPVISTFKRFKKRRIGRLPKCHLCFAVLQSTEELIAHLQRHLERAPGCVKCGLRVSVDYMPSGRGAPPLCTDHQE